MLGRRVSAGVGGVEAVDVREQQQTVGADHFGHAGGQAVIVAEADFGGGDAVILVDHGDAAEAEQGGQGGARVQVAAAVLGVFQGEQHLRRSQPVVGQRGRPGLRQADLADGGGGLFFLQPEAALVEPQRAPG